MASMKQRPDGRWRVRYRDPAGHEHAQHFARKVDAQRWLDSVAAGLVTGSYVDPRRGRVTFAEWVQQWRAESVHLKPKTVAGYDSILNRHVLPRLGAVPIAKIDRPFVKAWVAEMVEAGVGPGTIKNVANCAKAVFTSAVEGGALKVNPASGVRLPRPLHREMVFLDAGQVLALADTIDESYRTLVLVAAYTGLRAGELAALRWKNVHLLRGRTRRWPRASTRRSPSRSRSLCGLIADRT